MNESFETFREFEFLGDRRSMWKLTLVVRMVFIRVEKGLLVLKVGITS